MRCYVCQRETPPRQRYCDRCRLFFRAQTDKRKRRAALQEAYDKTADGFRCRYSGVLLEERDPDDPFHLCFDHLLPVRTSRLVVSSELFNHMKFELTEDEFHIAIKELAAHHDGRPFDRDCIAFSHWGVRAPAPPKGGLEKVVAGECVVCGGEPQRWSKYCPRCRRFVQWQHRDFRVRAGAMKEAWSADEGGFFCYYTGMSVNETRPWSPWFLTFDHRVPGDAGTIVVAAWWVNAMKSALSEDEFWKVVGEYNRYLREGGKFDRDIVGFDYWRKARRERGGGA